MCITIVPKPILWKKDRLLNTRCRNNWTATGKSVNLYTDLTPVTKINSRWMRDLNGKHKTIQLLEDNVGENLDDFGYDHDFLDTAPKAQSMKDIKAGFH